MNDSLDVYESRFGDGLVFPQAFVNQPRLFLQRAACFKFAAKMLGDTQPVLNLDAGDGFGAWILTQECGGCFAVEDDVSQRKKACETWRGETLTFGNSQALAAGVQTFSALVWLADEVPDQAPARLEIVLAKLDPMATALIGWGLNGRTAFDARILAQTMSARFRHCFTFTVEGAAVRPGSLDAGRPVLFLGAGLSNRGEQS